MGDTKFLPDSSLTSMTMGNDIYSYAQTYSGDLFEFRGAVTAQIYEASRRKSGIIIERLRGQAARPDAPKLFTPIAVTSFAERSNAVKNMRYVFYLDDNNILHDQYCTADGDFVHGKLAALKIQCAHYSALTAVTIQNSIVNFMCVFYQSPTPDAAIKSVNWAGIHNEWKPGNANLRDPPLYGTSLTAVNPRPGLLCRPSPDRSNDGQPIYYLQLDDNALASGQGSSEPLALTGYGTDGRPLAFSPHTSLTAVDNGTQLHLVYKSNGGKIKVIRIQDDKPQLPETILAEVDTAPRSAIAACLAPNTGLSTSIVLFYQSLDAVTRKVYMNARVLTKPTAASNQWTVSERERIGT